jgi:DNA-binding CsgD family transcriptional regulator
MPFSIEAARRRIAALAARAVDGAEFRSGVLDILRDVAPWDGAVLTQFDPATMLFTAGTMLNVDSSYNPIVARLEFSGNEPDHFADLATRSPGFAILSSTVGGDMAASARYREVLHPQGLRDELRAVCRTGRSCWGGVSLLREPGRDFTDDDASAIAALGSLIADGLRLMLLRSATTATDAPSLSGPTVLVLGPDGTVEGGTAEGLEALSQIADSHPEEAGLVAPVQAVVWRQRSSKSGVAHVRIRAADGTWLVLHAGALRSADGVPRTVVSIQPARPPDVVSIVAAGIGLTARETEVLEHLLAGRSSVEIGRRLFLSPYTVNDHVRHIFEKAGVHNRKELLAWLFFAHRPPRLGAST